MSTPASPQDWNRAVIEEFRTDGGKVGSARSAFTARTAAKDEREPIWSKQKQDYPGFADYEAGTTREIPVVILDPA